MMTLTESAARPVARDFFRPRRLGHTNLFVGDYLAAQQFYYKVAGFNEGYRQPDNLASFLSNGNSYHDLTLVDVKSHYNHDHCGPGMNHIAFELENEVDLADGWRRAKAAGVDFRCADHDVAHSLYTDDPDGNGVEFYADVVRDQREARKGIIIKQKPEYIPGVSSPALCGTVLSAKSEDRLRGRRNVPLAPLLARVAADRALRGDVRLLSRHRRSQSRFWRNDHAGVTVFAGTDSVGDVTLQRQRSNQPTGMHHFGLEVQDEADLVAGKAKAAAAGLEIVREIDHPARHTVCIKDPDGLIIQFYANRDFRPERLNGIDEDTALYLPVSGVPRATSVRHAERTTWRLRPRPITSPSRAFPSGSPRAVAMAVAKNSRLSRMSRFGIRRGEVVSLIGPSGCGKSTLLGIGSGLNPPSARPRLSRR